MTRYKVSVFRKTRRGGIVSMRTLAETIVETKEEAHTQMRAYHEEFTDCIVEIKAVK